jgi:hypothetical protein
VLRNYSLRLAAKNGGSEGTLLSQLRVEWRDEIVAFPRPAAFARCLPISESIPGLGPAYRHREHRGGLRPDLIVA